MSGSLSKTTQNFLMKTQFYTRLTEKGYDFDGVSKWEKQEDLLEYGKIVVKHGVKIVGPANLPAELPTDTSALFARNLLNFITPMIDKETKALKIDLADEVVKGTLVTQGGQIVHPALAPKQE